MAVVGSSLAKQAHIGPEEFIETLAYHSHCDFMSLQMLERLNSSSF